ncbi:MAG: hypothetical protein LBS71_00845 [Puniceicoccales bacterium]|nr:hypothetical protein [Puniceicoccales bacterium]
MKVFPKNKEYLLMEKFSLIYFTGIMMKKYRNIIRLLSYFAPSVTGYMCVNGSNSEISVIQFPTFVVTQVVKFPPKVGEGHMDFNAITVFRKFSPVHRRQSTTLVAA